MSGTPTGRYRGMRELEVRRAEQVTPHMRRVVLGGAELAGFGSGPNIKLLIPPPGLATPQWPMPDKDGGAIWPPAPFRPVPRTYSVRRFDAARGELWVDFALHEAGGPGADFARRARRGDLVGVGGPGGRTLPPADHVLLAGDQTGLPSIAAILEELPAHVRGHAFLEVAEAADAQPLEGPAGVQITYLYRDGAAPGTTDLLEAAVRGTHGIGGPGWAAWVATESAAARALRGHLRADRNMAAAMLAVAGYWKRGMSEPAYHAAHDHEHDHEHDDHKTGDARATAAGA
ncbi:siderophore-interacting protein [Xanthobacter sp. ZOL 2024]